MITIDLEQLTGQVCNLAKETGEFIRQERKKFRREQVEKKLKKGLSVAEIADMLEEEESVIVQIVEMINNNK